MKRLHEEDNKGLFGYIDLLNAYISVVSRTMTLSPSTSSLYEKGDGWYIYPINTQQQQQQQPL
jgi:hypothetical protein